MFIPFKSKIRSFIQSQIREELQSYIEYAQDKSSQDVAKDIWESQIHEEYEAWEQVIRDEYASPSGGNDFIRYVNAYMPQEIVDLLPKEKSEYNILDVGSGPRSAFGNLVKGKVVNLIACDSLADIYSSLLTKYGIEEIVKLVKVDAEKLLETFRYNQFDLVTARNCLDHSYSPEACILQMASVSNSYVYLLHCLNEGQTANYQGLHQWDFDIDNNNFIIKGRNTIINFTSKYSHLFESKIRVYDAVWKGRTQNWLEVILKK